MSGLLVMRGLAVAGILWGTTLLSSCGGGGDEPESKAPVQSRKSPEATLQESIDQAAVRLREALTPATEPVLDPETAKQVAVLAVESNANHKQEIVAFNAEGEKLGALTSDEWIKFDLSYCPATRRVIYVSRYEKEPGRWDIVSMALDGGAGWNLTLETPPVEEGLERLGKGLGGSAVRNTSPSYSGDGKLAVFSSRSSNSIYSLKMIREDRTGSPGPATLIREFEPPTVDGKRQYSGGAYLHPDFSPVANHVVCIQRDHQNGDIIGILDLDAEAAESGDWVANLQFALKMRPEYPHFSRDGKRLVYTLLSMENQDLDVYVIDVDAITGPDVRGTKVLTAKRGLVAQWMPDGTELLVGGDLGDGEHLYRVKIPTGDEEATPVRFDQIDNILRHPVWVGD